MQSALDHLQELYRGLRSTQKPDPGLLKSLKVSVESDHLPIDDVCLVSTVGSILKVQPYDRSWLSAVYQAIKDSKLGVLPEKTKDSILIKFPQLTGERRDELIAIAKDLAEKQKIAIRNIRRDARKEHPDAHKEIENLTAQSIKDVEELLAAKIEALRGKKFQF